MSGPSEDHFRGCLAGCFLGIVGMTALVVVGVPPRGEPDPEPPAAQQAEKGRSVDARLLELEWRLEAVEESLIGGGRGDE